VRFGGIHDCIGGKVNEVENEFVRVLRFYFVSLKNFIWEILQVHRDDHLRFALDGSRKYMAVVFVWQAQGWDQMLIAFDERIDSCFVHQVACSFELLPRYVLPVLEEVGNPLLMNGIGPLGAKETGERQVHQKVPKLRGI